MPGVLGEHVGLDPTGRNGVDGDGLVAAVGGEAAGEAFDGGLGTGVDGVVRDSGHGGCDGGHEDYTATVSNVAVSVLSDEELRASIEIEDAIVIFLRDVLLGAEDFGAGIGDDDVDAAEVREGLGEERGDLRDFGDVGLDGDRFAAVGFNLRDNFVGRCRAVGVVDDNGGAAFAELDGDACAETAAGAGDQGDAAVEAGVGVLHDAWWESGRGIVDRRGDSGVYTKEIGRMFREETVKRRVDSG